MIGVGRRASGGKSHGIPNAMQMSMVSLTIPKLSKSMPDCSQGCFQFAVIVFMTIPLIAARIVQEHFFDKGFFKRLYQDSHNAFKNSVLGILDTLRLLIVSLSSGMVKTSYVVIVIFFKTGFLLLGFFLDLPIKKEIRFFSELNHTVTYFEIEPFTK